MANEKVSVMDLADETLVAIKGTDNNITARELREKLEEKVAGVLEVTWVTVKKVQWELNAEDMVTTYIESQAQDKCEDFAEHVRGAISNQALKEIQLILERELQGNDCTSYYVADKVIDLTPYFKRADKKYRCIEEFSVAKYCDEGAYTGRPTRIEEGSVWEVENLKYNMISTSEAIHLNKVTDSSVIDWIEIYPDTLQEYFEEID